MQQEVTARGQTVGLHTCYGEKRISFKAGRVGVSLSCSQSITNGITGRVCHARRPGKSSVESRESQDLGNRASKRSGSQAVPTRKAFMIPE